MEPKNFPIEKEHHLNQASIFGFHVNFPGCMIWDAHPPSNSQVKVYSLQGSPTKDVNLIVVTVLGGCASQKYDVKEGMSRARIRVNSSDFTHLHIGHHF